MAGNLRVEQLQPQLRSAGVDVAVIRIAENVLFVSGHFVQIAGAGLVVVPAEGEATLLVPEYEAPEAAEVWDGALETFPVIRNDRPSGDSESENGCEAHQRSRVMKRQRKNCPARAPSRSR